MAEEVRVHYAIGIWQWHPRCFQAFSMHSALLGGFASFFLLPRLRCICIQLAALLALLCVIWAKLTTFWAQLVVAYPVGPCSQLLSQAYSEWAAT
jgi:uncharacterized membrane protein